MGPKDGVNCGKPEGGNEKGEWGPGKVGDLLRMEKMVAGSRKAVGAEGQGHSLEQRVEVAAEHTALRRSQRNGLVRTTAREAWSGRKKAISRWKGWERVKCHRENRTGLEEGGRGRLRGMWEGGVVIRPGLLLGGREPGLDLAHLSWCERGKAVRHEESQAGH